MDGSDNPFLQVVAHTNLTGILEITGGNVSKTGFAIQYSRLSGTRSIGRWVNDVYSSVFSYGDSGAVSTHVDMLPASSGSLDLGSTSMRFDNLNANSFNMHSSGNNINYITGSGSAQLIFSNDESDISIGGGKIRFDNSTGRFIFGGVQQNDGTVKDAFYVHLAGFCRIQPQVHIWPHSNSAYDLGTAALKFRDVFCDSLTEASDVRIKNSIVDLDDTKSVSLINNLHPKRYKLNQGQSGRFHMGLLSTDLKSALDTSGFNASDSAVYIKAQQDIDGNAITDGPESIRYTQMVAPLIKYVQLLEQRITALESNL